MNTSYLKQSIVKKFSHFFRMLIFLSHLKKYEAGVFIYKYSLVHVLSQDERKWILFFGNLIRCHLKYLMCFY